MALQLVIVDGTVATPTVNDIKFYGDNKVVKITGREPGDVIKDGEYKVAFYNASSQVFIGHFVAVPGFTVSGEVDPTNVTATPTDDGADVSQGDGTTTDPADTAK
ncbi:hypothetical protein (plasmid) [Lactobacillus brevis] [Lactiplantibacillus mudanjiangensis]|uniref:hypothetical protein n=1 Tax=Lactiplantibacillus mudanjiangensis TaxID=1296538 RepID=UPI0010146193|nr:hypothetical protein (plasmid) [Lactobacillus brevis] [Lactiplantibacillus mudanjiangensis]